MLCRYWNSLFWHQPSLLYQLFWHTIFGRPKKFSNKLIKKYRPILDIEAEANSIRKMAEAEKKQLNEDISRLEKSKDKLHTDNSNLLQKINGLRKELAFLEEEQEFQSFGFYEPKYDFGSSDQYKEHLDKIRKQQKEMVKYKQAVVCYTNWTVDNSARKGQTMINQHLKLMLRAFNGECDALIMKVKYNNIISIEKRLKQLRVSINRLGKSDNSEISSKYLKLKIDELRLVYEFERKKQEEKEEQRYIKEQIREEQRAQREFERAKIKSEKEEERYAKALEQAKKDVEKETGVKQERLQGQIKKLQERLAEAQANKERAKSRAEMTRSGYVYVISNIGSFGEDVYKIGLTRRLEPNDRIRELSGASVPFKFDIHAMIFSEDAPKLENQLHKKFANQRVNQVNDRKEFFNVSLDDIKDVVINNFPNAQFIMTALAEEYRETKLMMENR